MSEQATDTAVENAESGATTDIDAQLAQMQQSEQGAQTAGQPNDTQTGAEGQDGQQKQDQRPGAQKQPQMVPLPALHEERRERQRLAAELAQSRADMAKVNERLDKLFAPQQAKAPDPNENPVGYLDHKLDAVTQRLDSEAQARQQREQAETQQRQFAAVANAVNTAEAQFKATAPDFDAAVGHLNDFRARELILTGVPEDHARQQAEVELAQASLAWAAQGRNPAQMAYEFAKVRGYTAKPAAADPAQKIEQQQKGVAAARSLGSGGAPTQGRLTAESLAKMSDEEFGKLTEAQFRQAMGG